MRCMLIVFCVMLFLFVMLYSLGGNRVIWAFKVNNPVSNVGGWLFGLFSGFAIVPRVRA